MEVNKNIKIWLIWLILTWAPVLAYAATDSGMGLLGAGSGKLQAAGGNDVGGILDNFSGLLEKVIGILFVLVTVYFIWGIVEYVMAGGNPEAIQKGREHMIWGIIGMAVMASAWGIATAVSGTFFKDNSSQSIPSGPRQ